MKERLKKVIRINQLKARIEDLEMENETLKQDIKDKLFDNYRLDKEFPEKILKAKEETARYKELRDQLRYDNKTQLDEITKLKEEIEEYKKEITNLKRNVTRLKNENKRAKETI